MQTLRGKKTYVLAILALVTAWITYGTGDITLAEAVEATFGALGAMTLRAGMTTETAKKVVAPVFLALWMFGGCATSGPSDQLAGQAPVRGTSAAFNSVATTEADGTLSASPGGMSEGVDLPLMGKDGQPVFGPDGQPVYVKIGRGLRDVNFFFGEVSITAETTVSGTQSGAQQEQRQAPSNSPNISPNIPLTPAAGASRALPIIAPAPAPAPVIVETPEPPAPPAPSPVR